MRTLYMTSLVFFIADMYSKSPIKDAEILCNGKKTSYVKKRSGHYVFSNLYPGKYRVDIICKGYLDKKLEVEVRANETKTSVVNLAYACDNLIILNQTKFEIHVSDNGNPLKNKDVRIKLKNDLNFIKLLKKAKSGTDRLSFNTDQHSGMIMQRYIYLLDHEQIEFFIYAYDSQTSNFLLEDFLDNDLMPGGALLPVWDLSSDSSGRVVIPLFRQFLRDNIIKLEVICGNLHKDIEVEITDKSLTEKVIYLDANLQKIK